MIESGGSRHKYRVMGLGASFGVLWFLGLGCLVGCFAVFLGFHFPRSHWWDDLMQAVFLPKGWVTGPIGSGYCHLKEDCCFVQMPSSQH